MKNKTNITEMIPGDNVSTSVTSTPVPATPLPSSNTQKGPSVTISSDTAKKSPDLVNKLTKDKLNISIVDESIEPEAVIAPQDDATIKYLSNVKDNKTGEVSLPFIINNEKYRMVRAVTPSKEIIMGVGCIDETDKNNIKISHVHTIEEFEESIVKPIMEKEAMMQQEAMFGGDIEPKVEAKKEKDQGSLNLGEFKHFMVNEKSGKFRKFKNIVELASAVMNEDEKYMPIKEFRKYFENKVFGGKREPEMNIVEIAPTGEDSDEQMNIKAKKLMTVISSKIPQNVIKTINTPVAKREVIAAFAELIGVTRRDLPNLVNGLKDLVSTPIQPQAPAATGTAPIAEKKLFTKTELTESLLKPKVIKTIKVKDIK